MTIFIVGKKGSEAVKEIIAGTSIQRCLESSNISQHTLVNYGLVPSRLKEKLSGRKPKRILNPTIGMSKIETILLLKKNDILVPDSYYTLPKNEDENKFIIKRKYSSKGKGIREAKNNICKSTEYYQKFVEDRLYELRVLAFDWLPDTEWTVQRRCGDKDTIAWNFDAGGKFMNFKDNTLPIVKRARTISKKIIEILHMNFGAVDFIVNEKRDIIFLEINSAPGFKELSKPLYISAFKALCKDK